MRDGDVALGMLGVPRTHEIEWWLEAPDWAGTRIGSDVVQEWLGEPVRACQFNDADFAEVARMVGEAAKPALIGLRAARSETLRGLADAEDRLDERSRLARLRPQANEAWQRGDYVRAKSLYRSMAEALTPAEAKRLEIAERKAIVGL